MSKSLVVLLVVGLVLTVLLFIVGFSGESPVSVAVALFCSLPLTAFFAGGLFFRFLPRVRIVSADDTPARHSHRGRITEPLG